MLHDPELHLVILDELNIVLRYDTLPLAEVLEALAGKRPDLHVVVTGRNAKPELIEAADLVTEMKLVKHPFREGDQGPARRRVLIRRRPALASAQAAQRAQPGPVVGDAAEQRRGYQPEQPRLVAEEGLGRDHRLPVAHDQVLG